MRSWLLWGCEGLTQVRNAQNPDSNLVRPERQRARISTWARRARLLWSGSSRVAMSWASFDVSGDRFNDLDFDDAVLSFRVDDELPSVKRFLAWGLVLHGQHFATEASWDGSAAPTSDGPGVFVRSWSLITIEGVVAGELTLAPYRPLVDKRSGEILKEAGQPIELSKSWGSEEARRAATEYPFGTFLEFPYGNVQLILWATRGVRLCSERSTFEPYRPSINGGNPTFDWWREELIQELTRTCGDQST